MSPNDFIKEINQFGSKDVPELVKTVHQKITLEALTRLVQRTPVDTGRARGNWQVGIRGRPPGEVDVEGLLPHHDPPMSSAPSLAVAGQAALDDGQKRIQQIQPFMVSHVTNNVSYILLLEDGGSKQCPPNGMLVLTFEELAEMFG
jgi:hypothetical protein